MLLSKSPKVLSIVGDIHLNLRDKRLEGWERNRFIQLFKTLAEDDSNIVVLNGDIFDKAIVTLFEVAVFFEGIKLLTDAGKEVYVIDGNHEEIDDKRTTFDLLPHEGFTRFKADCIEFDSLYLWLVGHPHIATLDSPNFPIAKDKPNILLSHYRSDIGVAHEEVNNGVVSGRFTESILSDIHYKLEPAENIRYTSSPYGVTYTKDKFYGYTKLYINKKDFEIKDVQLHLPSKVKISVRAGDIVETFGTLDDDNMYKVEIVGQSSSEILQKIQEHSNITSFYFTENHDDEMIADITDELRVELHNSLQEIILVALDDLELTQEERDRAAKVLQEEL